MGVSREYFIMYGVKGDFYTFGDYSDEDFTPKYVVKPNNICNLNGGVYDVFADPKSVLISDGMCGEYSYFGILVSSSGGDRFGDDRDVNICLTRDNLGYLHFELEKLLLESSIPIDCFKDVVGLYVVRHYS